MCAYNAPLFKIDHGIPVTAVVPYEPPLHCIVAWLAKKLLHLFDRHSFSNALKIGLRDSRARRQEGECPDRREECTRDPHEQEQTPTPGGSGSRHARSAHGPISPMLVPDGSVK